MRNTNFAKLRTLSRFILENALSFEWSLQGLGMLRLHMGDDTRLHVWDLRFAFPGASPIHDHQQWGLDSTVVSGELTNKIYVEDALNGNPFMYKTIRAGYGCFDKHAPCLINLRIESEITYVRGDDYQQTPHQIHWTVPINGTVTVMRKTQNDSENARVFWDVGQEWGSAEPRKAHRDEVKEITSHALAMYG